MVGILPFAWIILLAGEASGSEDILNPSPLPHETQIAGIRIPATETPTAETLDELDRSHRAAQEEFDKECRRFITHTALDDRLTPAARMRAVEKWFVDQAPRIESLNRLADYLDIHSPLPAKPDRPTPVITDDPGAILAAELRELGLRLKDGEISLEVFDEAREVALARQPGPPAAAPPLRAGSPPPRETGDLHADYGTQARHLASLPAEEAAAIIGDPASPFNRAFRRLETAIENESPNPDPNKK